MTALATATTGRHRRPPLPRRALHAARLAVLRVLADVADWQLRAASWQLRRRTKAARAASEEARMLAWVSRARVKHKISPVAEAQITTYVHAQLAAKVQAMATDGFNVPPAAVLPDADDPRYPDLARAWSDDTGTFTKLAQEWTG